MTKLAIAAIALAVAGGGALAAVGVTRIANGQCPLTGEPVNCHASRQSDVSAPAAASPTTVVASPTGAAASQTAASAAAAECPVSHAKATAAAGAKECPNGQCVPGCEEDPPPQCEQKRCAKKAQAEPEKKAPAENP